MVPLAEGPPSLRRLREPFQCEEVNEYVPLRALTDLQ